MIIHTSKKYQKYFLFSVLCFGSVFFSSLVSAESNSITDLNAEQQKDLKKKQDQIDAINAKIKAYKQIVSLKQRQGSTLTDQITSLEAQEKKLELEIGTNKEKITGLTTDIDSLSKRIVEQENLFDRQKKMLSELMRIYHSDYSNEKALMLFSSDETLAFLNQENWTSQMESKISELLESIKILKESLLSERVNIEEKKKEADDIHAKLSEQDSYLESTKSTKASLLAKTVAEQKKYSSLVKSLEEEQSDIEDEINRLQAGTSGSYEDMPDAKRGLLEYPVKKIIITQGYGMTAYAKKGAYGGGPHNGVDFGISSGTPIYAPMSGKVVGVGSMYKNGRWYGYGRWIAIDHGNGIVTLYGHLSSQSVKNGQKVSTGDKIGSSGNTGYSTGPHLHFSVFSAQSYKVVASTSVKGISLPYGAHVNPMKYLP